MCDTAQEGDLAEADWRRLSPSAYPFLLRPLFFVVHVAEAGSARATGLKR